MLAVGLALAAVAEYDWKAKSCEKAKKTNTWALA